MTLVEKLDKRIADIDAEIARVQAQAVEQVRELNGSKANLVQIRATIASRPEYERLIELAKQQGLL